MSDVKIKGGYIIHVKTIFPMADLIIFDTRNHIHPDNIHGVRNSYSVIMVILYNYFQHKSPDYNRVTINN